MQQARRFYRWQGESSLACVVRVVCMGLADYHWLITLPRISSVAIANRAPIANPPNSAQLGGIPYHSPSYIWVRAIV